MIDKTYNPHSIEKKWYDLWEKNNCFTPKDHKNIKNNKSYCIVIPPPNVTGTLHMGHAFQDTLMDILIRYNRMKQHKTLWQVGTDHAGIATQMVVERQLAKQELSRHDLGREKFIEKIWEWKEKSGKTIGTQLKRLGASVDWSRERFTMDKDLSKAVTKVFIDLYNEGLIYRGKKLANWDPILHTAISDLEVISEEEQGSLWYIKYPILDLNNSYLTIATTRPETMLGDTAVAVNPNDDRYKNLIGKKINLPLTDRIIPIIADDYVETDFGTGCVKITPAHDFNDYEIGQRHNLEQINIFTIDAKLNENCPKQYQGLDRFIARAQIIKDLETQNLLEKIEPYTLKVPRGDRSGAIIEPYLTNQWFVKIESLAKPAIDAFHQNKFKFIPENWGKTYLHWMENIQDWCISRQLWWGHRIPAWYDQDNNIYVGETEIEIREKNNLSEKFQLTQDSDVLDTWFSAALWPFASLGWPNQENKDQQTDLKNFFPNNVLVTGFDIIFFWVARMLMMSLKFMGQVPFKEIYIHGLILDHYGNKMSKSKGNVLDPIDLIDGIDLETLVAKRVTGLMQPKMAKTIEKQTRKEYPTGINSFGTDALRFTFCSMATTGRHIRFDLSRVEGYRNFCNKLWNATRYVLMNLKIENSENFSSIHNLPNQWIFSVWQKTKQNIENYINNYRFDLASYEIYNFVWNEYCDWYLELSKPLLNNGSILKNNSKSNTVLETQYTLITILKELLCVIHPIMPFITEEIWSKLGNADNYLINQPYPEINQNFIFDNQNVEPKITWLKSFIVGIRNIRGEINISPKKTLSVYLINYSDLDEKYLIENETLLKGLANIDIITKLSDPKEIIGATATFMVDQLQIFIPLIGLVDPDLELKRLDKELAKLHKDLILINKKLENTNYVNKAPKEVVVKEQAKKNSIHEQISILEESKNKFSV